MSVTHVTAEQIIAQQPPIIGIMPYTAVDGKLSLPSEAACMAGAALWHATATGEAIDGATVAFSGEEYGAQAPTGLLIHKALTDELLPGGLLRDLYPRNSSPGQLEELDSFQRKYFPLDRMAVVVHKNHRPRVERLCESGNMNVALIDVVDILEHTEAYPELIAPTKAFDKQNPRYERLPMLLTRTIAPLGLHATAWAFDRLTAVMGNNQLRTDGHTLPSGDASYTYRYSRVR